MKKLIAGTRGSKLAIIQTEIVNNLLKKEIPNINIETKIIKTKGDKILDSPLALIGGKGLFTKELEVSLINGTIDFAVHSLKDLPVELPENMILASYLKRDRPNDVLISRENKKLIDIKKNGTIATGSIRRRLQLQKIRPDLKIVDIRGNVETRIKKMMDLNYDGIILSAAGLDRMNLSDKITEVFAFDQMLSASGQGIIAIECLKNNDVFNLLKKINHKETEWSACCEKSFLKEMGGGCQMPIACYSQVINNKLKVKALFMTDDGSKFILKEIEGNKEDAVSLGKEIAQIILQEKGL